MRFLFDDRPVQETTRNTLESARGECVFDHDQYVVLDLALGGAYPAGWSKVTAPYLGLPQSSVDRIAGGGVRAEVDSVRVEQKGESCKAALRGLRLLPQQPREAFAEHPAVDPLALDAQRGRQVTHMQVGQGLGEFGEGLRGRAPAPHARGDGDAPDECRRPPPQRQHQIP